MNNCEINEIDEGVSARPLHTVRWYRKAAEQNFVTGQYNLGVFYATGSGVELNKQEARRWFEKAQALGHPKANKALAILSKQ